MTDIICISSSEDEEDSSKKRLVNGDQNKKRKQSTSLDNQNRNKRSKTDDANKLSSNSSISNNNLSDTNLFSLKKSDSKCDNSVNERFSPKPGPSKQDESQTKESDYLTKPSHRENLHKKVIRPQLVIQKKVSIPEPSENIFIKFLEVCEQKQPSDENKKIFNKLRKKYEKLSSIDKNDKEFQNFLSIGVKKISNDHNNKFYAHIREVQDEIKRRINCPIITSEKKLNTDPKQQIIEKAKDVQQIVLSDDNMRRVRKLQKAIERCQRKIKELEEKEVDFDEDEDSAYLQEDRYKRKLVELYYELNKVVEDKMLKKEITKKQIKRKDIPDEMTGIPSVDESIINFINCNIKEIDILKHIKNMNAIADFLVAPDYNDVLDCIKKCNEQKGLDLTKKKMEYLAKKAFKAIGSHLKKQRVQESDEYISFFLEIGNSADPATKDLALNAKLQMNKKDGDKKLQDIFQKYVDKQEGLTVEELENYDEESVSDSESENNETSKDKPIFDINKLQFEKNKDNDSGCVDTNSEESKSKNDEIKEIVVESDCTKEINNSEKKESKNKDHEHFEIQPNVAETNSSNNVIPIAADDDILKESISATQNSLSADNKPEDNNKKVCNTVIENILPDESTPKQLEIIEISDEIEILPNDDKDNNETNGSESTEDKNHTNFIKVCSFAKPPKSWKDTSSPEKNKLNVEKGKKDLFINPLAVRNLPVKTATSKKIFKIDSQSVKIVKYSPQNGVRRNVNNSNMHNKPPSSKRIVIQRDPLTLE